MLIARSGAVDPIDVLAVGIRRRAQHVSIQQAEHRRVRADAQSERDDCDESEARRAAEGLDREPKVTEDGEYGGHESTSPGPGVRLPSDALSCQSGEAVRRQPASLGG